MNCGTVRQIVTTGGEREWPPDVSAHIATCDVCLSVIVEQALATVPQPRVPSNFADRVGALIPQAESPTRSRPRWSVAAAGALCAAVIVAAVGVLLASADLPGRAAEPSWYWALLLVAGGESAVLVAWAAEPLGQWGSGTGE
jgi:hypothetical protein